MKSSNNHRTLENMLSLFCYSKLLTALQIANSIKELFTNSKSKLWALQQNLCVKWIEVDLFAMHLLQMHSMFSSGYPQYLFWFREDLKNKTKHIYGNFRVLAGH